MRWAKNFFTEEEKQQIIQAIMDAEKNTSAEIRVHIENFCWGDPLKRAQSVFDEHKMYLTENRNAVLFYISVWNKKLAIFADKGIYEKVEHHFWETLVQQLILSMRENKNKAHTLCECIKKVGFVLSTYFPPSSDNPDELSNEIIY